MAVNSWLSSSSELSAAMALLQTVTVFIAVALLFAVARSVSRGIALRAGEPL